MFIKMNVNELAQLIQDTMGFTAIGAGMLARYLQHELEVDSTIKSIWYKSIKKNFVEYTKRSDFLDLYIKDLKRTQYSYTELQEMDLYSFYDVVKRLDFIHTILVNSQLPYNGCIIVSEYPW